MRQQLSINLRHCYSSRRVTQNMLAAHNSPTIGSNLRALPLSAFTVSLHYLPRRLHSIVTCGKTPTTVTWSASSKICYHVIVTQQRPIVNNSLPSFATCLCRQRADMSELQAHNCMLSKQWTWPVCSVSVISANRLSFARINANNQNQIPDFTFCRKFCFLVPISREGKCPFCPPCGRPCFLALALLCDVHYLTVEKLSWELFIYCYVTNVT